MMRTYIARDAVAPVNGRRLEGSVTGEDTRVTSKDHIGLLDTNSYYTQVRGHGVMRV